MEDEQRGRLRTAGIAILGALAAIGVGILLWMVLANYIKPATAAERKDVVNMLVLSAAAVVGSLTALAAVGNLYFSRRNLQQQRELDDRRAQDDALQNYFEQMGELLTMHGLMKTKCKDDPLRLLARAHTLTVLRRLEGSRRKADVALFLEGAELINRGNPIVSLDGADLAEVNLSGAPLNRASLNGAFLNDADLSDTDLSDADLRGAFLARTNLSGANLRNADLRGAILSDVILSEAILVQADLSGTDLIDADLSNANLSNAYLSDAFLRGATVEERQLEQAESLTGTTMPDGTQHP